MTTQTNTTLVEEAVERIKIDIALAKGLAEIGEDWPCVGVSIVDLETLLASLPTDDDDTVERVARAIYAKTAKLGLCVTMPQSRVLAEAAINSLGTGE